MNGGADRLVAVFGAGRNGSTLIGRLLDGAPGLWVHPVEINYLSVWDDLERLGSTQPRTVQSAKTRRLGSLASSLPAQRLIAEYHLQWRDLEEDYATKLAEKPAETGEAPSELLEQDRYRADEFLPAFLDATRRAYGGGDASAAPLLLFKTIETPYVSDYMRVFPKLRCIHIIRDPASNYASLKRTWQESKSLAFYHGGEDILKTFLEARWLPHARAIGRYVEAAPERHTLVRYEDLTRDPMGEIGRLCAWLGVPPPPDPALQTALGGHEFAVVPANPSKRDVAPPARVVADMARTYGYREVLTRRERDLIERVTAPYLPGLGYKEEHARASALRLWLRWLPPEKSERANARSRIRLMFELIRRRIYVTRKLLEASRP